MLFIRQVREALEYAPRDVKVPADLAGWHRPDAGVVCAQCAARLTARGCGTMLKGFDPLWGDAWAKRSTALGFCLGCETRPRSSTAIDADGSRRFHLELEASKRLASAGFDSVDGLPGDES